MLVHKPLVPWCVLPRSGTYAEKEVVRGEHPGKGKKANSGRSAITQKTRNRDSRCRPERRASRNTDPAVISPSDIVLFHTLPFCIYCSFASTPFHLFRSPILRHCLSSKMSLSIDDLVASMSSNHIGQEAMELAALQVSDTCWAVRPSTLLMRAPLRHSSGRPSSTSPWLRA